MTIRIKIAFLLTFIALSMAFAQPPKSEPYIKIIVAPNHADWTYKLNEEVVFEIEVRKNNVLLPNAKVEFEIAEEQMEASEKGTLILNNGEGEISTKGMSKAGFLRCFVKVEYEGEIYSEFATAGFEPFSIEETVKLPPFFNSFWSNEIAKNREFPFDTKMTLLPERCTENVNVYHVSIQNWRKGARLYGILCMPKAEGKYPAVLKVPGAGIRAYYGDVELAENGIISFEIGIHGISVIMPQENYNDLLAGWNNDYWNDGVHDKYGFYYNRVYLGCIKANDFLCSLPQWDGKNLGVMGSSQGGALTLVTAGLDPRVTAAAPTHPAMCDMTGYLAGRAGGWPHYLKDQSKWELGSHKEMVETITFYDGVNFARRITCPVFMSFGYNDNVVPPTSIFAAYNLLGGPKELFIAHKSAHWVFPEQTKKTRNWMMSQMGVQKD